MATNVTSIKNGACLYGLRFGCVNTTNDPNCNKCAERLANAVNRVLRRRHRRARGKVVQSSLQRLF
jgi:hypothetical protein